MNNDLRAYIDSLFAEAPPIKKTVEIKEEILTNLLDKYNDLIAEGKSEEAAYNLSVASVGDISELIEELKGTVSPREVNIDYETEKKRNAFLTSIAVALYILCVTPVILIQDEAGIVLMFIMIATATALLIYKNMTRTAFSKREETIAEEFREWREQSSARHQAFKSISSALWALTVVVYIIISFWTHAWHITWVIFLIAAAVNSIIKAVFDLQK